MRGNVLDLAVGVIIGAAFQAIVTSLTSDIISPILGIFGGVNFDQFQVTINGATIMYGKFISEIDIKATKCPHCTGDIIDLTEKTDDKK